jgi:multidrug efflux pump
MEHKRMHILGDMPVNKAIFKLAIPTMLGMIVMILYHLTDTFFIGKLNDPDQVAAIAIAMPIFMAFIAFGGLFGNGGASYLSRLLGKKDYDNASRTASTAFFTCGIFAVVITFVGIALLPGVLRIAGSSENTFSYAYSYSAIIIWGNILIMLNFAMGQLLRAEGAAKEVMIGMFIGTGVNIVLDPLFILALHMGITGAAIATLIGNAVGLVYYIMFHARKKSFVAISIRRFSLSWKIHSEILKVGIPTSLNQILMSASFAFINSIAVTYGDIVVAAMGIDMRITSIPIMLLIGTATGIQPLIGYSYGARNTKRLKDTIRGGIIVGTSIALFFAMIFIIFPRQLILVFINNAEVIAVGAKIMFALAVGLPFIGIQMVFMVALQAMGKGGPSLIISVSRQGLIFIPAILILNGLFGFSGFIYAQSTTDFFTAILSLTFFTIILRAEKKALAGKQSGALHVEGGLQEQVSPVDN